MDADQGPDQPISPLDRNEEALTHLLAGLAVVREVGHRVGEADALNQLGAVCSALGDHDRAMAHHDQAMEIAAADGIRELQVHALNATGVTNLRLDRPRGRLPATAVPSP